MKSFAQNVREELEKIEEPLACEMAQSSGFRLFSKNNTNSKSKIDWELLQTSECKRAFLRGAFLASGYITDPNKTYHAEILVSFSKLRNDFSVLLEELSLPSKWVRKHAFYAFYFKNSEAIGDLLGIIGANKSMLDFLNVKVSKEDNSNLNRRINAETSNLDRTIIASIKQIESINKIGIENLPEKFKEIAASRLRHPQSSLAEIAKSLGTTKSHVNHCFSSIDKLIIKERK